MIILRLLFFAFLAFVYAIFAIVLGFFYAIKEYINLIPITWRQLMGQKKKVKPLDIKMAEEDVAPVQGEQGSEVTEVPPLGLAVYYPMKSNRFWD